MIDFPSTHYIIIIGNGFDLSLGLKTSYRDFMESENYKKFSKENPELSEYLVHKLSENSGRWVDIELELANFSVDDINDLSQDEMKGQFKALKNHLTDYLIEQQKNEINPDS